MHIVFAGGAASGKSSTIRLLKEHVVFDPMYPVFFLPEAFGLLFQKIPSCYMNQILTPETCGIRQYIIAKYEIQMTAQLLMAVPHAVVISDRGFWDIEAYCNAADTARIMENIGSDIPLHDYCIFFESLRTPENLHSDTQTYRIECSLEENLKLAGATREAWAAHTPPDRFISVCQYDTILEKARKVAGILNERIGHMVFSL